MFGLSVGTVDLGSSISTIPFNSATDVIAYLFDSLTEDPITHVWIYYGTKTGVPFTVQYALEGIASTSPPAPDGTVKGGGSPASVQITPPNDATWNDTGQWHALANPYTPTLGEALALTARHVSGTADGSNFIRLGNSANGSVPPVSQRPITVLSDAGGAFARVNSGVIMAYRTATRTYGWPMLGSVFNFTPTTAGRRTAAWFEYLPGQTGTFTFRRCYLTPRGRAAGTNLKIGLWNAAGTELISRTYPMNVLSLKDSSSVLACVFQGALPELNCGEKYYLGVENVDGASGDVALYGYNLGHADHRQAWPDGENVGTADWNGSAWSETNSRIFPIAIDIESLSLVGEGSDGIVDPLGGLVR